MKIDATTIVTLVLLATSIFLSVISACRSAKKSKNTSKNTVEVEDGVVTSTQDSNKGNKNFLDYFSETLTTLISNITLAEELFNAISTGKTGNLKLVDVLNKIKIDCLSNGEEFDENAWTNIINELITLTKSVNKNSI